MRVSTKVRFAVQAMIDLALQQRAGPVSLAVISARQGVSLSFMEQLFSRLRKHGLVEATRGPGGGYTLARSADAVSVGEIVAAVDEPGEESEAERRGDIETGLWAELDRVMQSHLDGITLRSLVEGKVAVVAPPPRTPRRVPAAPLVREPVRSNAPNSVFAFGLSFAR